MQPHESHSTELHQINRAEVIRALTEARRHDPEVIKALADIQLAEIQAREGMAGIFLQVLMFSADQLGANRRFTRCSARERRLSKAFQLASASIEMLARECAALACGTDLGNVLREMDRAVPPLSWIPELRSEPLEQEWSR